MIQCTSLVGGGGGAWSSITGGKVEMYLLFAHSSPNLKTESEAFATAFGRQPKESIISSLGRVLKVLGSWPSSLYRDYLLCGLGAEKKAMLCKQKF